jgi:hypothetical protein
MSELTLNPEVDERLRGFIERPGNFLDDIGLVHALLSNDIIAAPEPFFVRIGDQKIIPIFSTEADLEAFTSGLATSEDELTWVTRPFMDILHDMQVERLDGIAFNLKMTSDGDTGNSTLFTPDDLGVFLNYYSDILTKVVAYNPEHSDDPYYLIPGYEIEKPDEPGQVIRYFELLQNNSGESYIPMFDNLESFSSWYNYLPFSEKFKENYGRIFAWRMSDLISPESGHHEFGDALGVTINPMDYETADASIKSWDELGLTGSNDETDVEPTEFDD